MILDERNDRDDMEEEVQVTDSIWDFLRDPDFIEEGRYISGLLDDVILTSDDPNRSESYIMNMRFRIYIILLLCDVY